MRRVLLPMTLNCVYLSHGGNRKKTTLGEVMSTTHGREEFLFRARVILFPFFFLFEDSKYISWSSYFNPPHLTPRARKKGTDAS